MVARTRMHAIHNESLATLGKSLLHVYMKHSSSNVCLRVFRKGVCKKTAKNIILVNKSISSRYNGDIGVGVGVLATIRDTLFEDVESFFIDRELIDLKREDTARRASD